MNMQHEGCTLYLVPPYSFYLVSHGRDLPGPLTELCEVPSNNSATAREGATTAVGWLISGLAGT